MEYNESSAVPQNWTQLTYLLAHQVIKLDIVKSFLTIPETETFYDALTSFEGWQDFIQANKTTAFRVRVMLFEQFVRYTSDKPCCQNKNIKWNELLNQSSIPLLQQQQLQDYTTTDHVPLLDTYHTLEFDMTAMLEQRKLEQEQQEQQQHEPSTTILPVLQDTKEFNMRFLLKGIAENRNKTSLSDRDLRNLLLEVKPQSSKWGNEEKEGFYNACEKVLTDLRNFTEHSTPFLNKVSKRDAPDYFEIIKNPMDLGTVSKKLKNGQYKSKQAFGDDLYLIYENCLVYNSDPTNEYRKHATAMKRKTDRILSRIPDITLHEDQDEESDEDDDMIYKRRSSTRERSMTHDSAVTTDETLHASFGGKQAQTHTAQQPWQAKEEEPTIEIDMGELQNQIWSDITKLTRGNLTLDIEKQYQFDFGNRFAFSRNSLDMERFSRIEHSHHQPEITKKLIRCSRTALLRWLKRRDPFTSAYDEFDLTSEDEEGFDGGFFFAKPDKPPLTDTDDAIRTDLFLPEYALGSGLPEIDSIPEEYFEEESQETLDMYPSTQLNSFGLGSIMNQNIDLLQSLRSLHHKCHSIQYNTPITIPNTHQDPSIYSHITLDIPAKTIIVNKQAGQQMMEKSLAQLLTHAGFEGAQSNALHILTELASDYFLNIGKTLRSYMDQHHHTMSAEQMMEHTLSENGTSVHDLDDYITHDIQHYGSRLTDMKHKLEHTFQDLATVTVEHEVIEDDSEQFITGAFEKELDQDFFGFKELGLGDTLKVPSHLWFGKPSFTKRISHESTCQYTPPPAFIPVTSDAFIGLLKPWFQQRDSDIPEDEYIPPKRARPRNPPVNQRSAYSGHQQSNISKRRILKDGSNTNGNEEAKRKRKRLLEEQKAQKKQQKLEIKAQKQAEKELKKKHREEEKLKKKAIQ